MAKIKQPVLYLQSDSKWGSHDYSAVGEKTTIRAEGCGITCSAMVIASLANSKITPVETAEWSKAHGYKAKGQGTYYAYFKPQFAEYGIECYMLNSKNCYHDPSSDCHKKAFQAIKNGDWVIACMGKGNWTTSGHYILWYSMNGTNVLINDPWSTKKVQTDAPYTLFKNEVKYYWIIKMPKKFKEDDDEMVEQDIVIVDDKEFTVSMIRKDGFTYIKTRDLAEACGYQSDNEGRIPILTSKKE